MPLTFIAGSLCAFSFAAITVLYDCHLALKTFLKRVPISVVKSREAWLLSIVCGLIALIAFRFTNGKGDSAIDAILTLKQPQDVLRGISVGVMVLVLIRSKLTTIKGSELGGKLFYTSARSWVVERVNQRWGAYKRAFNSRNMQCALAIPDYDTLILEQIRQAVKVHEEEYRSIVETQIKNILDGRP